MALFISVGNTICFTNSIPMIVLGTYALGHAKSKDLLHWEELPVALAPSENYDKDGCFSGSAIVKDDKLPICFTGHIDDEEKEKRPVFVQFQRMEHFRKICQPTMIHVQHIEGIADMLIFVIPKSL